MIRRWCVAFDLNYFAASYQFLQFLINAELNKPHGHQLVVGVRSGPQGFRVSKGGRSADDSQALLENVMLPAIALIGGIFPNEGEEAMCSPSQYYPEVIEAAKQGRKIPKFTVPDYYMDRAARWLNGRKPIVITLRECHYWPHRNSNLEAWLKFAFERKKAGEDVVFVRDTHKANDQLGSIETCPLASKDILFRAALMQSAKANLHVANGPCMLSFYSDVPFLNFKQLCPEHPEYRPGQPEWWRANGLEVGEQFPWSSPTQRLTWTDDSYDNIVRKWEELKEFKDGLFTDAG